VNYQRKTQKFTVKGDQSAQRTCEQDPSSGELSMEALNQVIGGLLPAVQKTGISSATGGAGAG
jgi:hypothetical protein